MQAEPQIMIFQRLTTGNYPIGFMQIRQYQIKMPRFFRQDEWPYPIAVPGGSIPLIYAGLRQ